MQNDSTRAAAALIDAWSVYLPSGGKFDAAAGLVRSLETVLGGVDHMAHDSVVILDGPRRSDFPIRRGDTVDVWRLVSDAGPWLMFESSAGRTVNVGLRYEFTSQHRALFGEETPAGEVVDRLAEFSARSGVTWRGTPATTGHQLMRLTCGNTPGKGGSSFVRAPMWRANLVGGGYCHEALIWRRGDTSGCVTYDVRGAYLAAAGTLELGWAAPTHTGPIQFDPTLPGYWQLALDRATIDHYVAVDTMPPVLNPRRIDRHGITWVTTPLARLLLDLGDRCEVVDSWTSQPRFSAEGRRVHPAGVRVLRKWAEQLRDGIDAGGADEVTRAIKRTYKDSTGALRRAGGRVERPDWGHMIVEQARAMLWRRIHAANVDAGMRPVRVATDSVTYRHSTPELEAALRVSATIEGARLGQLRYAGVEA